MTVTPAPVTPDEPNAAKSPWWRRGGITLLTVAFVTLMLSIASLGTSIPSLSWATWGETLASFVGLFSLSLTAATGYLAIQIFRRQSVQAAEDKRAQDETLERIDGVAARAASEAGNARKNTDVILQKLNVAAEFKLHKPLSRESVARVELAYGATSVEGGRALWVDDNPDWIQPEREALESAGVATVWVRSTEFALELLSGNQFDIVISDMGRREGDRAGYQLLDAMRRGGDSTPFVVYSTSGRSDHIAEVLKHGGQGATNDPVELFELTMSELRR